MKTLVVYYSRTGNTKRAAEKIAQLMKADLESINDKRDRCGLIGYLSAGFDATFERTTKIFETKYNPKDYDLVIIGTPIWSGNMSAAVKTYLIQNQGKFRKAAFFYCGGISTTAIFDNMAELSGIQPVATLEIFDKDFENGALEGKLKGFALGIDQKK